jgi:acyl carrier protein
MPDAVPIQSAIADFIRNELVRSPDPIDPSFSLIDSGILDSLGVLKLVLFLEQRYGIQVDAGDVIPKNFESIDAICAYVDKRTQVG